MPNNIVSVVVLKHNTMPTYYNAYIYEPRRIEIDLMANLQKCIYRLLFRDNASNLDAKIYRKHFYDMQQSEM